MKKLSLVLALIMIATALFVACGGTDTDGDGTKAATTTLKTTAPQRTNATEDPGLNQEPETPDLAEVDITIDGDLSDWEALGLHTVSVQGEKNGDLDTSNKHVTFYGVFATDGIYLACDAYHDIYLYEAAGNWFENSNFEFFIGAGRSKQRYVYARGIDQEPSVSSDGDITEVVMKTEKIDQGTVYHTVTEVFIKIDNIAESDIYYNTIDIGVAWKTIGDVIIGGAGTVGKNNEDEYWVPKGSWPDGDSKTIIAPSGIFVIGEYEY